MEKMKLMAVFCWVVVMIFAGVSGETTPVSTTLEPCSGNTYGPGGGNCSPCGECKQLPCNTRTGVCTGGCKPGYTSSTCKTECPSGYYDDCKKECGHCRDREVCNKTTGACTACEPGYKYSSSNRLCKTPCDSGKYGDNCDDTCSANCATTCLKDTGYCLCRPGYIPSTKCASECNKENWGQNCTKACGSFCTTPSLGERKCDKVNGHCACKVGYKTPNCTTRCDRGRYGQNCVETCGNCAAGSASCNHVTGACLRCKDNYEPPLCKVCLPGHWGYTCGQLCGHCGEDGRCNQLTGHCDSGDCLPGWTSASCDQKCPEGRYGLNCTQQCGSCRDSSHCRHDNGVCELSCEDGYEGVLCKTEKESLTGTIVGSVMGAACLIALAILAAVCFLRLYPRRQNQPRTPEKDFPTLAELHEVQPAEEAEADTQRQSQIYQNVSPAINSNYDHVERRPCGSGSNNDEHYYDSQTTLSTAALVNQTSAPPTSSPENSSSSPEPVYQNPTEVGVTASVVPTSNKPRVALKPNKARQNRAGAARDGRDVINSVEPEETYVNL